MSKSVTCKDEMRAWIHNEMQDECMIIKEGMKGETQMVEYVVGK